MERKDAIKVIDRMLVAIAFSDQKIAIGRPEEVKEALLYALDSLKTDEMYNLLAETPPDIFENWIPCSERLPEKAGRYLVTYGSNLDGYRQVCMKMYSPNLHNVDEFDFPNKKRPGWYDYDSEYGHYEWDDVIAWMPLPEVYKERGE